MKSFYYIHNLLQIALFLQFIIIIGAQLNGMDLDKQLKKMVNETLEKYRTPKDNEIGNTEFNEKLERLREENDFELLIYEYKEFEAYDGRRLVLEDILKEFIDILDNDTSSKNAKIYQELKDKFMKELNMSNDSKLLSILDGFEKLKEYFDGDKDKDKDRDQFEKAVLELLNNIFGKTAKYIVDQLLGDKKEFERLKEKLKDDDDDDDNDWSIWNDISELFGLA